MRRKNENKSNNVNVAILNWAKYEFEVLLGWIETDSKLNNQINAVLEWEDWKKSLSKCFTLCLEWVSLLYA